MIGWLRLVLPRGSLVSVALILLVLFCIIIEVSLGVLLGDPAVEASAEASRDIAHTLRRVEGGALVFAALMLGAQRIMFFSPLRPDYRAFLAATPYTGRQPLPLGPLHLVWQDLVILGGATAFCVFAAGMPAHLIVFVFALGYVAALLLTLCATGQILSAYALAFTMGLAVMTAWNALWAFLALTAVYGVSYAAIAMMLRRFPWDTGRDADDASRATRERVLGTILPRSRRQPAPNLADIGVVGWPLSALGPRRPGAACPSAHGLMISLLLGWYLFAILLPFPSIPAREWKACWFVILVFAAILGAVRLCVYKNGAAAPISLLGRIATGRFIVPAHDKVLLAPAGTGLVGLIRAPLAHKLGISPGVTLIVAPALMLLIVLTAGPTLANWRLTGAYRVEQIGNVQKAT